MNLTRSDFLYDLPPELIAQRPLATREESRMMVLDRRGGSVAHRHFAEIIEVLSPGDLLVLNDTRVIPARLFGVKAGGGGQVEILLLRKVEGDSWKAMVRPGRRLKRGAEIQLPGGAVALVRQSFPDGTRLLELRAGGGVEALLATHGITPLPPYIHREGSEDEPFHRQRYQTVYAREEGSVAAPTAGLHFTPAILKAIADKGVETARLLLHVGMGTFRPVQVEDISHHHMDEEYFSIPPAAAESIERARREGRRIIAVGTTTTRALESAAAGSGGEVAPGSGWTNLFIRPGFNFQVVGGLLTNFHLPGSTLIMLVAAFSGREFVLASYAEAIRRRYRFYSYGDCMLVI